MTDAQPQPATPPPPEGLRPTASVAATSNAHLIGPVGLVIAGLLGLIGGLLPWVSISISAGGVSQSIQGSSSMAGISKDGFGTAIAVVLGAFILLFAAGYLFGGRSRRLLGLAAVLSLLIFGFGIFKITDLYRRANDLYNRMSELTGNASVPGLTRGGESFDFRDFIHIEPAPGLWMVAVSGLLGTVLSLFVLRQTKPQVLGAVPGQRWQQPLPSRPAPIRPDAAPPTLAPASGVERSAQPQSPAQHPAQDGHRLRPAAPPNPAADPPEDMAPQ